MGALGGELDQIERLTEETAEVFGVEGKRFVLRELLGSGSYGSVYRCSLELTGPEGQLVEDPPATFAVKIIDTIRISVITGYAIELVCPRLRQEVAILRCLGSHPHILQLHYAFYSEETHRFFLVTECVEGGDLFQNIVRRQRPFGEKETRVVLTQLVDAVDFCHERGVAHRDLKLENILVQDSKSLGVKLCDYGQAKLLSSQGFVSSAQTLTTTPAYTAPDVRRAVDAALPYDAFKADAFGLGVVMYGMLCSALPDAARGRSYGQHKRWSMLSFEARDLIQGLLAPDPAQRLAVWDIREHPWMQAEPATGVITPPSSDVGGDVRVGVEPYRKLEVKALTVSQGLVIALQRERGACCWARSSAKGEAELHWRLQCTGDSLEELRGLIETLVRRGGSHEALWTDVGAALSEVFERITRMREKFGTAIAKRDEAIRGEEGFRDVFHSYSSTIQKFISAMDTLVWMLTQPSSPATWGAAAATAPTNGELRYRLLQLTAEQLGRERAFLCGHLDQPETLRSGIVIVELAKIIGARQILIGSSQGDDAGDSIVASDAGLVATLRLAEAKPIEAADLLRLEAAEMRALDLEQGGAPAATEAFHLLTEIIDKIHQHIMVSLIELPRCFEAAPARAAEDSPVQQEALAAATC